MGREWGSGWSDAFGSLLLGGQGAVLPFLGRAEEMWSSTLPDTGKASHLPGSKSPTFRKHRQSDAWPHLCVCPDSGRLTTVSTDTSGSEHIDAFCTRLILQTCKYGAPGLGCNQGVFVNTSMLFDLENSEGDVNWFSEWYCFLRGKNSQWSTLKREKRKHVCDFLRIRE